MRRERGRCVARVQGLPQMSDVDAVEDFVEGELLEDLPRDSGTNNNNNNNRHQNQQPSQSQSHIKSYIAILVSALGGVDYSANTDTLPYKLGVEAFLCLQDIEKWIRSHDHKEHSWEVAVACAESGLVTDLVTILCMWNDSLNKKSTISGYSKKHDERIAKMCLKLLVLLTWPLELTGDMFRRQLDHYSELKKHQLNYKKHILSYRGGAVLHSIIKIVLPVIAKEKREREKVDYLVIRQCVAFFRNILQIEPAGVSKAASKQLKQAELTENLPKGVTFDDVSIGACVGAFGNNLVFTFFLTMYSSIGVDREFDPQLMVQPFQEIIFFMLRKLKPSYIMAQDGAANSDGQSSSMGLSELLSKEKEMVTNFKKHSSSRHGRFGTLISLETPDMGRLTVSNAGNLLSKNNSIAAFDTHKKWNKTQRFKYLPGEDIVQPHIAIGSGNRDIFREFVCDFIDGAFNPFVKACTRVLASNASNDPPSDEDDQLKIQYIMVVSWFLEAQRERYGDQLEQVDYTLVASVLSDEAFVLFQKYFHESVDLKKWSLAHACMILFKEILHVGDTLSVSSLEENRNISTNLRKRIFKDLYLDPLPAIARNAFKRAPEFVGTTVDFLDLLLKELDVYAKADMKKVILLEKEKKFAKVFSEEQIAIELLDEKDEDALMRAANDLSLSRMKTRDILLGRLTHPETINTYVSFIKRFRDVSEKSLKSAIKFFHRIFFTLKRHSLLYRLDFLLAIHTMLSPDGLPDNSSVRKHVDQFLGHFMKKLKQSLDTTPTLYVEMLFPLMNEKDFRFFLDTGDIFVPYSRTKAKVLVTSSVEIKGAEFMDLERKVSIIVACLIDDDQRALVQWASERLEKIVTIRLQEDTEDVPLDKDASAEAGPRKHRDIRITSSNDLYLKKLVTDPKLRYLFKLAGVSLASSTANDSFFYANSDLSNLISVNTYIKMYLITPVELDEGMVANDYLKRRSLKDDYRNSNENDGYDPDAYQNIGYSSEEEDAFGGDNSDGGDSGKTRIGYMDDELDKLEDSIDRMESSSRPRGIARKKSGKDKSKKRFKQKKSSVSDLPMHELSEDEENKPRRRVESAAYKSAAFILDSDEEEGFDSEFFARERMMRELLDKGNGLLPPEQIREFFNTQVAHAQVDDDGIGDGIMDINDTFKRHQSESLDSSDVKRRKTIEETQEDDDLRSEGDSDGDLVDSESGDDSLSGIEESQDDQTKATSDEVNTLEKRRARIDDSDTDDYDILDVEDIVEAPLNEGTEVNDNEEQEEDHEEYDEDEAVKAPKKRIIISDDEQGDE